MRIAIFSLVTTVAAALFLLAQEPTPPAPTLAEVLAKVRPALKADAFSTDHPAFKATGKIVRYGLESDLELILDGQGRFRSTTGGILGETHTYDGTDVFGLDWCGATSRVLLHDQDVALLGAWLTTGFWAVRPEKFELAVDAKATTDQAVVVKVKRKDGVMTFAVAIDRSTWRPTHAVTKLRDLSYRYEFTDYSDGPGLRIPRRWTHTVSGLSARAEITSIQKCDSLSPDTFRLSRKLSSHAVFDASKNGKLQVKKVVTGHLLVKPTIAGEDIGWFILDSGAGHSCIDSKLVQKLQLEEFGEVPVMGVGGALKSKFAKSPSLELGPVTFKEPTYVKLDLAMIGAIMGERINGIIGYPLFQSAVVEIDCDEPAVTLHNPAGFALPEGAAWQTLILDSNHPIVECKYEGDRAGWFRLDTGATDTVSFSSHAVRNKKLLDGRKTTVTMQGGVGGMVRARAGKLKWFDLAGHRFNNPSVTFSQSDKGALADEYLDGNLGQAFFRPFRIVFNYPQEQIAFLKKPEGE